MSEQGLLSAGASPHLAQLLATMTEVVHSSSWSVERLQSIVTKYGDRSWVATSEVDGKLLGYAFAYPLTAFNECMFPDATVFMRRLFVAPDARGMGLGARLLSKVIAESEHAVTWQTSSEAVEMIRWLERRGYSPVGAISNGRREDLVFRSDAGIHS